jgi:farnesyl diphosphate synthase
VSADAALAAAMAGVAAAVEAELDRLLPRPDGKGAPPALALAMRHACLGGGKRLRPFLTVAAGRLLAADEASLLRAGVAVELVHSYSLVHDDLPCMDDAALRRGRPTVHKAHGEANAVLAGDALQALAFEVLARNDWPAPPAERAALVAGLARAAGAAGMCGGQALDLEAERRRDLDEAAVVRLQALKTGALIGFCCEAACVLGGAAPSERRAFQTYAAALGLAFQIRDDLLDAEGDAAALGKDAGRDAAAGKATFVGLLGREGAAARLEGLRAQASAALDNLGRDATLLRDLFDFAINRKA